MMNAMHIVHVSTVHKASDPRIRYKEIDSIVSRGWRATLVTGDLLAQKGDELKVLPIRPGNARRLQRMLLTTPLAVLWACKENADIYHIHDPELLPWSLLFRLKGRPVVYDIHEDYASSALHKTYLPRFMRFMTGLVVKQAERVLARPFYKVIAERYYHKRFPEALPVLNYPPLSLLDCGQVFDPGSRRLLYTGNVTESRGGMAMARFLRYRPEFSLVAAGYCSEEVASAMRLELGSDDSGLHLPGLGRYVPFEEIEQAYRAGGWLAGLALFPDSEHYREKELTKFFEYMAVGLPVVASDFPAWRRLIQEQGLGLCVDSENPHNVAKALDWLRDHPEQARAMGERGRTYVANVYNWEGEAERLMDFYQRIGSPSNHQTRIRD